MLDDGVDAAAGAFAGGRLDDQRDSERFFVSEHAVPRFAVVAEPLAVVGRQDDRRLVVELVRLEVLDEAADEFVDVRNLAVVRLERFKTRRRCVRRVRLVEVEEQERPFGARLFEPALRRWRPTGRRRAASPLPGSPGLTSGILPSKNAKPCAIPVDGRSEYDDTTPAVA